MKDMITIEFTHNTPFTHITLYGEEEAVTCLQLAFQVKGFTLYAYIRKFESSQPAKPVLDRFSIDILGHLTRNVSIWWLDSCGSN